jgi:hypothetical protein
MKLAASMLLAATALLPNQGLSAATSPFCLPARIGPATLSCYSPAARSIARQRISPALPDPEATVKRITCLKLKQVMLFFTETAPPAQPQPFAIDYLFGTGLRSGSGGVTVPGTNPKYILVSEGLGGQPSHAVTRRDLGALNGFRIHVLESSLVPWTFQAPLPQGNVTLLATGNLSKRRIQIVGRAILDLSR